MPKTLTYSGELVVVKCWCGIASAVPGSLHAEQMRKHEHGGEMSIYCPLGHMFVPGGESKASRLERQLQEEREVGNRLVAELDQAKASARAHKGAATRARNRAKNGVCPCCHRTVKQLAAHMKSKHPDFDPTQED